MVLIFMRPRSFALFGNEMRSQAFIKDEDALNVRNTFNFRHPHCALGAMLFLMEHSEYHRRWRLQALNTDIVPAIKLEQYRIFHTPKGSLIGFVTWANVSSEVKDVITQRRRPMLYSDWCSGTILMFNDFIAPFGHARLIVNELRSSVFADREAFSLKRGADGSILKIFHWRGKNIHERTGLIESLGST